MIKWIGSSWFLFFYPLVCFGGIQVNTTNWQNSVTFSGTNDNQYLFSSKIGNVDKRGRNDYLMRGKFQTQGGGNLDQNVWYYGQSDQNRCPASMDGDAMGGGVSKEQEMRMVQWASNRLSQGMTYFVDRNTLPPSGSKLTGIGQVQILTMSCYAYTPTQTLYNVYTITFNDGFYIDPPIEKPQSSCFLTNNNVDLLFLSNDLNVSGMNEYTYLQITCTDGTPQNYQLKLTGNNVINGRLTFGNGVSAQISLNNTPVAANGNGIRLNSLNGYNSIKVTAQLMGTASSSGVSNSSGILVLEAL
ncbi:hypothetical protein ABN085_18725 [Morganella morganii]|uniref:hypothetical protein n=1 Tax=Morganella morganii TaxID=582 RepID=UPI0032DB63F9